MIGKARTKISDVNQVRDVKSEMTELSSVREALEAADAVIIGAGAGLSTSAGFVYTGENFTKYFSDFEEKYGFHDMYSGGFYPYETLEEHWAYWSRYVYVNRYMDAPTPLYQELLALVQDKEYFVITTNVDHCFQKAGFDKSRLFYTQGDYGLFQCSKPCHDGTYDNEDIIRKMVLAQGFQIGRFGELTLPDGTVPEMVVPAELIPKCPKCGRPMSMNLRADNTFVQDDGWYKSAERYDEFIRKNQNTKVVYLELGVGYNTPGIIKFVFHKLTKNNRRATYVCINYGEACAPEEIADRSIIINADCGEVLRQLLT